MKTPSAASSANLGNSVREEQLVAIAAEFFASKGYDGTSLREIAEAAGITKAALYYWFPEKGKLFKHVVAARLTKLFETVSTAAAEGKTPLDKIRLFMLKSAEQMENDRTGWMTSSETFWTSLDMEIRKELVPLRDQFEGLLRSFIEDAICMEQFREVNPALATRLLLSALNFMPRWHKKGGPLSAAEVVNQYLDMVFHGLQRH